MKTKWPIWVFAFLFVAGFAQRLPASPNSLTQAEKEDGWQLLFDGESMDLWRGARSEFFPEKGWIIQDGLLRVQGGGGDIVTRERYSEFELKLDFLFTEGANSGIKYFVNFYGDTPLGLEYQILDDEKHPDGAQGVGGNRTLASLYDLIPPEGKQIYPAGEWNTARILAKDGHVEHWLNGKKVLEYPRGSQIFRALVQKSKYADLKNFGCQPDGHILLQEHGDVVTFRNIKIKILK